MAESPPTPRSCAVPCLCGHPLSLAGQHRAHRQDEQANAYSALFYGVPIINTILLPVLMAVLASRLWDVEVKGYTAKLLYTLQSRRSLFFGKAVFGLGKLC